MKKRKLMIFLSLVISVFVFLSCDVNVLNDVIPLENKNVSEISDAEILNYLNEQGFKTDDCFFDGDEIFVEGDIIFKKEIVCERIKNAASKTTYVLKAPYYVTADNIRDVTLSVNSTVPVSWQTAINQAINDWNTIPKCAVRFRLVSSNAELVISYETLSKTTTVASASGGAVNGNAGGNIRINTNYDHITAGTKRTTMVHEMGHIIGFMHNNGDSVPSGYTLAIPGSGPDEGNVSVMFPFVHEWTGFSAGDILAAQLVYPLRWTGTHGIANRWDFASIFGGTQELYVTHRNNGQFYATKLNANGTRNNYSWNGHGIADRWAFAKIFGGTQDIYVTHRNNGQFYATRLNANGTVNNWMWSGHGIADRWAFAKIFGGTQDIYVTHRNNGQFYATRLNANSTVNNWMWSGHGFADRWAFAKIFGGTQDIYVTHRNNGQFYATRLNSNGTVNNWMWNGHGIADFWQFADIFGTGRDIYVTHRPTGEFYGTQLNSDGTVRNWMWKGHGIAHYSGFVDFFGNGREVFVTYNNNGTIYITQLNENGTVVNMTLPWAFPMADRCDFANIYGDGHYSFVTHDDLGIITAIGANFPQ